VDLESFRNKLIVFEGADLTGKTTVAKMMVDKLNDNGIPAEFTFQPGDPNYGVTAPLFRSFCKDKRWDLHAITNFFIFFADKVEQADKVIRPALEVGKTVISDRWWYSTYAYQYHGKQIQRDWNIPKELGDWLNNLSVLNYKPDITYYFSKKLSVKREEDKNDQFEISGDDFFKRVNDAYEELAENLNFVRVNPKSSAEETLQHILALSAK
jgi:dTMP kinase